MIDRRIRVGQAKRAEGKVGGGGEDEGFLGPSKFAIPIIAGLEGGGNRALGLTKIHSTGENPKVNSAREEGGVEKKT